ncbi:hypothetical protein RVR_8230 [Actinacidiphila reveromycinica]|uniref:DUF4034 domain-containing protein n=1 Tax=Actinacidiphila reveromycinica TaxID=659352 RepID=A0A7U3UYI6_9ACTN|nr:hypothetical protein [Streptomyces sp. SN-593]BBB01002.1 hypothetical protein RVR_8230 [Streptomyces sp. SN-593]
MAWRRLLQVRQPEGHAYALRRRGGNPAVDRSFGDPRLAAMREAAHGGATRWPEVRGHLEAADGHEDLTFLVEGVQDIARVEQWTAEVVAADPGDTLALLVCGARHVEWAYQARNRGTAGSGEQEKLFRERLTAAEERLYEVAGREPSWAAPWYFLQVSGRALQVGQEEAERRFEEVGRRAPGHVAAHRQHLQQLCAKWGGSQERMHAFAREAALSAPEGSGLGQLVAQAHLEDWKEAGGDPDSTLLHAPETVRALHEAGARSVHHPAFVRRGDWAVGVNTFALAFALAGEDAAARAMFRMVRKLPT